MQLNQIKRIHKLKKQAPVGRGSKRGKTSGRGTKGQKARAGRKLRPEIRDVIMRLPKLRGRGTNAFVSRFKRPTEIKLGELNAKFDSGALVNKEALVKAGLVTVSQGFKVIGGGKLDKVLKLEGCQVTKSVKAAVEQAGGSVK